IRYLIVTGVQTCALPIFGGSIGLAIFATLLGRSATQARASIAAHLGTTSPIAQLQLEQIAQGLIGRGLDAVSAHAAAPRALAAEIGRASCRERESRPGDS